MQNINKFEKEKLLNLLECKETDLEIMVKDLDLIDNKNIYDVLLKILQKGYNLREATLAGIIIGEKLGYSKAKIEFEEEIKNKLYKAFKNSQ